MMDSVKQTLEHIALHWVIEELNLITTVSELALEFFGKRLVGVDLNPIAYIKPKTHVAVYIRAKDVEEWKKMTEAFRLYLKNKGREDLLGKIIVISVDFLEGFWV